MRRESKGKTKQAAAESFDIKQAYGHIEAVFGENDIQQIKPKVEALLRYIESADKKQKALVCNGFLDWLARYGAEYSRPNVANGLNVVLVPTKDASRIVLFNFMRLTSKPIEVISGLKKFVSHCGNFIKPLKPIITEEEILATLKAAQGAYRILDIIAPDHPLYIFSFNNSHKVHNSECGISDDGSRRSAIMLYHPRESGTYGRVFIFAHELGHALHMALTGDVNTMPDGFDAFNESLGVSFPSLQAKQEAFADVAAHAILGSPGGGLEEFLPGILSKELVALFVDYLGKATEKYLCEGLTLNS